MCYSDKCIPKNSVCDFTYDCDDKSDEDKIFCEKYEKFPEQRSNINNCLLKMGKNVSAYDKSTTKFIENHSYILSVSYPTLHFTCPISYNLVNTNNNFCIRGRFEDVPECIKYCPPLIQDPNTVATCKYKNDHANCYGIIKPSTSLDIACLTGYKKPLNIKINKMICGDDGNWSSPPFQCQIKCNGKKPDSIYHMGNNYYLYTEKVSCELTQLTWKIFILPSLCLWDKVNNSFYNGTKYEIVKQFLTGGVLEFNVSNIVYSDDYYIAIVILQRRITYFGLDIFYCFKNKLMPIETIVFESFSKINKHRCDKFDIVERTYIDDDISLRTIHNNTSEICKFKPNYSNCHWSSDPMNSYFIKKNIKFLSGLRIYCNENNKPLDLYFNIFYYMNFIQAIIDKFDS